jgi:hypothetical protein
MITASTALTLVQRLPNSPRKAYIRPCVQPAKQARPMTIAVVFRCKDGVILCSDTQITKAAGKTYGSKIFPIKDDGDYPRRWPRN